MRHGFDNTTKKTKKHELAYIVEGSYLYISHFEINLSIQVDTSYLCSRCWGFKLTYITRGFPV